MLIISSGNDQELIKKLNKSGSWAAVMWEWNASMGHLVIVDGFNDQGKLLIRDPWDGTSYKMQSHDFLAVWSRIGLYSRA